MTAATEEQAGPTLAEAREKLLETDAFETETIGLADAEIGTRTSDDGVPLVSMAVEGETVPLSIHAIKNLAGILGIPANYLLLCPPTLQAQNIEHWKGELSDRKRGKVIIAQEKIQAVTSPNYEPTPNIPVFDALVEKIADGDESLVSLDFFEHDWESTRVGLCHSNASHTIENDLFQDANPGAHVNDVVRAGINFTNSLVNVFRPELEALIFRLWCSNRMVEPLAKDARYRYMGPEKTGSPLDWLAESVDEIGQRYETIFRSLDDAAKNKLSDDALRHALEAQAEHLPGPYREELFSAFENEQMASTWGVVNAITRAARDVGGEPAHILRVERHAGDFAINRVCTSCHRPFNGR